MQVENENKSKGWSKESCTESMTKCKLVFVSLFIYLVFPTSAHAYLDPGTGSLILQAAIGAFVAAVVTFKLWWRKLITFFRKPNKGDYEDKNEGQE